MTPLRQRMLEDMPVRNLPDTRFNPIPIARRLGRGFVQPVLGPPSRRRISRHCPPSSRRAARLRTLCVIGCRRPVPPATDIRVLVLAIAVNLHVLSE